MINPGFWITASGLAHPNHTPTLLTKIRLMFRKLLWDMDMKKLFALCAENYYGKRI